MENEAEIGQNELSLFMRLSSVDNSDLMLDRDAQNQIAHSMTVGLMAYHLQRAFRSHPIRTGNKS